MPLAAPRPCTHQGCGTLVRDGTGRCEQHKREARKRSDAHRGTAHQRGYTAAWQRARDAFLREHPLCAECQRQGAVGPASAVDHIKAHKGDMVLFWDRGNWQLLCKTHHDRKTASEDGGFGRVIVSRQ